MSARLWDCFWRNSRHGQCGGGPSILNHLSGNEKGRDKEDDFAASVLLPPYRWSVRFTLYAGVMVFPAVHRLPDLFEAGVVPRNYGRSGLALVISSCPRNPGRKWVIHDWQGWRHVWSKLKSAAFFNCGAFFNLCQHRGGGGDGDGIGVADYWWW